MTYGAGNKPIKKLLSGTDAIKWLPFAMRKLRDMYRNSQAPVLHNEFHFPGVDIQVQKRQAVDVIRISTTAGGFFMSILFRIESDDIGAIGETIYATQVYQSSTIEKGWTQVGSPIEYRDDIPAGDYDPAIGINGDPRALKPAVGSRVVNNLSELSVLPYKGELLEVMRHVYHPENIDYEYPGEVPLTDFSMTFKGIDYDTRLQIQDIYIVSGHNPLPVFKDGNKGIYFFVGGNDLQLGFFTDGENQFANVTTITGAIDYRHFHPNMVNLMPDVVLGFDVWSSNVRPPKFFITRDGGQTIFDVYGGSFLSALSASNGPLGQGGCIMVPLSANSILFGAPRPGDYLGPYGAHYDFYRMTVSDGNIIADTFLFSFPPPFGPFQCLNLGGGCIAVFQPNFYNANPLTGNVTYTSGRYVSFDNGLTFTYSPMTIPQWPNHTAALTLAPLFQVLPLEPYVSEDQPGAIYTVSRESLLTGYTDALLFKSVDQGATWEEVTTLASKDTFPPWRTFGIVPLYTASSSFVERVEYLDPFVRAIRLVPTGTKDSPIAIDPIHPYRCDDSVLPPASWTS